MKSFKRMVIVSSTLICGLLLAAGYADQEKVEQVSTQATKTSAEQLDVLQPGYPGMIAGIPLVVFY